MMIKLLLLALAVFGSVFSESAVPTCMKARNRCVSRIGCSMALNNFHIACEQVKLGTADHCTDMCMRAVVSLVTVDDDIGTEYLTCDCTGNEDCMLWKRRIAMCTDDVLKALRSLDNEEVISCSLARMLCEADTQCWTALSYYEELCSNLWSRHSADKLECSPSCNNSLSILYRQTRATKLKNCLCDNTDPVIDEPTCIRMRYNTETYCLKQQPENPFIVNIPNPAPNTHGEQKKNDTSYKVIIVNTAPANSSGSQTTFAFTIVVSLMFGALNLT